MSPIVIITFIYFLMELFHHKLSFCLTFWILGPEYLFFVFSCSLKMKEKFTNWDNLVFLSLYIYIFLAESHLCLLLQNTFFCKSKQRWLRAQKKYKLRQTKLSWFVYFSFVLREWEETKTKYSATRTLEPQS